MAMLTVNNVSLSYGKTQALKEIDVTIEEGSIVSIIGANGAGKSSLLRILSGLEKPQTGTITYLGAPLPSLPSKIAAAGLIQVPEGRRVFSSLTVEENLKCGAYVVKSKDETTKKMNEMFQKFPRLLERKKQYAGTLSGGEQQMLVIARALMSSPKLLLLDEPSLGLSPLIVNDVFRIIREINQNGVTILLVEQNAKKALSIADYAIVLENGKIKKEGIGADLLNDPTIAEAYLGSRNICEK